MSYHERESSGGEINIIRSPLQTIDKTYEHYKLGILFNAGHSDGMLATMNIPNRSIYLVARTEQEHQRAANFLLSNRGLKSADINQLLSNNDLDGARVLLTFDELLSRITQNETEGVRLLDLLGQQLRHYVVEGMMGTLRDSVREGDIELAKAYWDMMNTAVQLLRNDVMVAKIIDVNLMQSQPPLSEAVEQERLKFVSTYQEIESINLDPHLINELKQIGQKLNNS